MVKVLKGEKAIVNFDLNLSVKRSVIVFRKKEFLSKLFLKTCCHHSIFIFHKLFTTISYHKHNFYSRVTVDTLSCGLYTDQT